jgi:plastocyanin
MRMPRHAFLLAAALAAGAVQAATHDVSVVNFAFSPRNLTIEAGDTVRWTNEGGVHNVVADDGSFGNDLSSAGWVFTVTFDEAGAFPYFCEAHGGPDGAGMSGRITVQGAPPPPPPPDPVFVINEGVAGSWYNPATSGQGILLEASTSAGVLTLAWFTWTTEGGGYDWLTGAGGFEGGTATVDLVRTTGGRFDDPAPVQNTVVGTAQLTFTDCSHATFSYTLPEPQGSGEIPLQRILPANPACLEANPPARAGSGD